MNSNDDGATDWQRVRRLFDEAIERPAAEREAFVASLEVDEGVRSELRSLLAHHADDTGGDGLLSTPAGAQLLAGMNRQGERFGPWEIDGPLGAGGMGEVFRAHRADGTFEGLAAIKVLKRGMDSAAVLARFSRERHALGRLEHPNIARMMDAGLSNDGLPYFVMEYVAGVPIDEATQGLPLEGRIGLFLQLADAVAYAHRNLLVHRDLKPGNILVTPQGQVKLLDFGIAKALDPTDSEAADATLGAQRPFTPNYASPEQVRGEPVGTGTDIYSLGVLLYQLLTGVRPTGRDATTPAEAARSVLEETPTRPSSLPAAGEAGSKWLSTRRRLQGDLDNILLKALEKPVERRYETVEALSKDLRHYLAGLPVSARAPSAGYVLSKFVLRHRALVAAVGVALVAVLAGLAGTAWQAVRAERALASAQQRLKDIRGLSKEVVVRYGDAITYLPGGMKLKEKMLTNTVGYLDRLLLEAGDDELAFKGEIAMAYARLADVQVDNHLNSLQNDAQGGSNADRAIRLFAQAEPSAPQDPNFYVWWARAHKSRFQSLRAAGNVDGALGELTAAQDVLRRGLARFPGEPEIRANTGSILLSIGQLKDTVLWANKGRPDEALAALEQASVIYQALAQETHKGFEPYVNQFQLGTIDGARGIVFLKRNDLDRARAFMRSAVDYRLRAVAMEPENMSVHSGVVSEATNLATVCLDLGDAACALEASGTAWAQLDYLQKQDPQNAEWARSRANAALHHGRALVANGKPREALDALRWAEEDLTPRASVPGAPAAVVTRLARTRMAKAAALWALQRNAEALAAAQAAHSELLQVSAKSPNNAEAWMWLGEVDALLALHVPAQRAPWRRAAREAYDRSAALKPLAGVHRAAWQQLRG